MVPNFDGELSFNAARFSAMSYVGDAFSVFDVLYNEERLMGMGASNNSWSHWAGRRSREPVYVGRFTDSPFVGCYENRDYEQRLFNLLDQYAGVSPEVTAVDWRYFCFDHRFEGANMFGSLHHWLKIFLFKCPWRGTRRMPIMVG